MPQPFIKGATNASALYKGSSKEEQRFHDKNNIAPLDAGMLIVITATMLFITVQSEVLYWTQWSL